MTPLKSFLKLGLAVPIGAGGDHQFHFFGFDPLNVSSQIRVIGPGQIIVASEVLGLSFLAIFIPFQNMILTASAHQMGGLLNRPAGLYVVYVHKHRYV